jgi:hypothetical protein
LCDNSRAWGIIPCLMVVGTRSLSSGAHSRDQLALPTLPPAPQDRGTYRRDTDKS